MMKTSNKIFISILCGLMVGTYTFPVYGLEQSSPKEEVIYASLNQSGTLEKAYVVNIVYPQNNQLVDYGNYSEVKNLTSTDKLIYKNNQVKATTDEEKISYEGYLIEQKLPWNFKIKYYLDGKEISEKKIAGCKGQLTIEIEITRNENVDSVYFDNYALQITAVLNSNNCKNIIANGATIANVGDDKQITYTLLPGNSKTLKITSDVTDFEMDSIAINGVKLNLGLDASSIDTTSLDEKVIEIKNAVNSLDSGASQINNGAASLNQGSDDLVAGIVQIKEALTTLNQQSDSLITGSNEVQEALSSLNSTLQIIDTDASKIKQLINSSSQIQTGIDSLVTSLNSMNQGINQYQQSVGGSISNIYQQSAAMIEQLQQLMMMDTDNRELYQQIIGLLQAGIASEQILEEFNNQLDATATNTNVINGALMLQSNYQLFNQEIVNLANSLSSILDNMTQLKTGINTLSSNYRILNTGFNNYTDALNQIVNGYNKIYNGSLTLANGTSSLYQGTQELVQGTTTFKDQTDNIDQTVTDSIDQMINEFSNDDYQAISYVSANNSIVYDVQFVITTPVIEKEVEKEIIEEQEPKSIIDRVLEFLGF